jgi:hypothetical protein
LKVTSRGLSAAILSQKAVISSFSVLSPTCGAPMASTALTPFMNLQYERDHRRKGDQ